ncbi:MAG: choice-of-anchor L domain-containing protein, partial [Bacteroidota bacterium]
VFIKGNCRNVSNISAIGSEALGIGQFFDGSDAITINNGIILSTGDIGLAMGPNIDNESSFSFDALSNDPDLSQLATADLFDVTGIEFDFVPISDRVTFRYVFASEEYCEFVGTEFNDVFGFFVSGPGIVGPYENDAINVATFTTLSGITESVSINNINHLSNETFYVDNITTTDAQNCEIPYVPTVQDLIEYDGLTIPLTASFAVIPCETYRIRIVLGDVGDPNLDSAVFLESNSFDLGEKVLVQAEVPGRSDTVAYEGCVDGQFVFIRSNPRDLGEECTVNFSISPTSEAINGVDFSTIPSSITIPAGDTSYTLAIEIIEDNIPEGRESLRLELVYDCDCIDPVVSELVIDEADDLSMSLEGLTTCADQVFSLTPEITGGVAPLDFLWDTGETAETLINSIVEPVQYSLTITDFCGETSIAIVNIDVQEAPLVTLIGSYDYCEVSEGGIPVLLEGTPPWAFSYNVDGIGQPSIVNIQNSPFFLSTPVPGRYEIISFQDAFCEGNISSDALVEYNTFNVEVEVISPSCFNSNDGSVRITELEAIAPFSVDWNVEANDENFLDRLNEGTYVLNITDANGCVYEEIFNLAALSDNVEDCIAIYIPNSFSPNFDGVNDEYVVFIGENSGISVISSYQVYDRWGALVFENNNFQVGNGATGWFGNYNGKPLNTGVFVYRMQLILDDRSTIELSGNITLLR